MIQSLEEKHPDIAGAGFIAWNAEVIGDVSIGKDSGVWYSATIRGDVDSIRIGERSNIQDGVVLHVDPGCPMNIGDGVTVGHGAILHGCTLADNVLIGMGAIVLNNAKIGEGSIVGAGALVTEGKEFPPRSLIVGSPAKAIRTVSDEMYAQIQENAAHYVENAVYHRTQAGALDAK